MTELTRRSSGRARQAIRKGGLNGHLDIASNPAFATHPTALSPQGRARICEAIRHELALEDFRRTNSRREAWARIVIGLPPIPRPLHWERRR